LGSPAALPETATNMASPASRIRHFGGFLKAPFLSGE
jgi:hypothetical protein